MRTQDLDRFERLARILACGGELPEDEVESVLEATRRTREELEARAEMHRWRVSAPPRPPSPLESYQEEAKVLGVHEGMVVVWIPILLGTIAILILAVALAFA